MSELTVLGSCGAWPEPGRACAGFLLVHEGFKLVLDLGPPRDVGPFRMTTFLLPHHVPNYGARPG